MARTQLFSDINRAAGDYESVELVVNPTLDVRAKLAVEAADDQWSDDVDDISVSLEASEDGVTWRHICGFTEGKGGSRVRQVDTGEESRAHVVVPMSLVSSHFPTALSVRLRAKLRVLSPIRCVVAAEIE